MSQEAVKPKESVAAGGSLSKVIPDYSLKDLVTKLALIKSDQMEYLFKLCLEKTFFFQN
jgi:hypothetical protein